MKKKKKYYNYLQCRLRLLVLTFSLFVPPIVKSGECSAAIGIYINPLRQFSTVRKNVNKHIRCNIYIYMLLNTLIIKHYRLLCVKKI